MFEFRHLVIVWSLLQLVPACHSAAIPFTIRNTTVDGLDLFYREAGHPSDPMILLLHGSPDSSFQYRNLMPYLADNGYHVLAPDYPGFGFTYVPPERNYTYDFTSVINTLDVWLTGRNVKQFSMYIFDYGAPIGFGLAMLDKYNISAIIDQNGAAYMDSFGSGIEPLLNYGNDPTNQTYLNAILAALSPAYIQYLYLEGQPDPNQIAPEAYTLDNAIIALPGRIDIFLKYFISFAKSLQDFPAIHAWLRKNQPPLLAIWGKNDVAQRPAGAKAFKKDLPNAEVVLVDAGHFALESQLIQIASTTVAFLRANGI